MTRLLRSLLAATALMLSLPALAEKAPEFTVQTANGSLSLSELKGKVVYLDFWASWCNPCRSSFPWMSAMQDRYGEYGLVIVGVNVDKEKELVDAFLAETKPSFRIGFDPDGELAGLYDVQAMPSSYLIDKNGNLVKTHMGFREGDKAKLEQEIRHLLQ